MFAIIATIISAAFSAFSAIQQGRAQKQAAEYNAAIAENQAQWDRYNAQRQADIARQQAEYAEQNAALARAEAEKNARKKEEEGRRLLAAQKTRYGKAGVLLEGTPLDVMAQTALEVDSDRLDLLHQGEIEAWNWSHKAWQYRTSADSALIEGSAQASADRSRAALNRLKGAQAGRAGWMKAGSTILTGAAKAFTPSSPKKNSLLKESDLTFTFGD